MKGIWPLSISGFERGWYKEVSQFKWFDVYCNIPFQFQYILVKKAWVNMHSFLTYVAQLYYNETKIIQCHAYFCLVCICSRLQHWSMIMLAICVSPDRMYWIDNITKLAKATTKKIITNISTLNDWYAMLDTSYSYQTRPSSEIVTFGRIIGNKTRAPRTKVPRQKAPHNEIIIASSYLFMFIMLKFKIS